jgi:phosphoenolpyruvate carboxylase
MCFIVPRVIYHLQNVFMVIDSEFNKTWFLARRDRDGNPFVTTEITLNVAERLRTSILKCYT